MRRFMVLVAGLVFVVGSVALQANEKVEVKDLPKVALDAVKAKFPKAEIVSAEVENKDGKKIFDIKIKDEKHELTVDVSEEGKIVEIEKKIEAKDLPKAVTDAIEAKHPKAKIDAAEEITIGEVVSFKVKVTTVEGTKAELSIDAAGKIAKPAAEEKKEEKKEAGKM